MDLKWNYREWTREVDHPPKVHLAQAEICFGIFHNYKLQVLSSVSVLDTNLVLSLATYLLVGATNSSRS